MSLLYEPVRKIKGRRQYGMSQDMVYLDPLVDNTNIKLEDIYRRVLPETEELRIATGYFYLSGFDLLQEDIKSLLDPEDLEHAPMRVLMGRQTDRSTSDEITEGQSLREQFREEVREDISELNHAQLDRLDQLKEFI